MSPHSPREVELKFELGPADLDALEGDLVRRFGEGETRHLASVYFDTSGSDLHKAGFSLRIRSERDRDGFIQTVKSSPARGAGLFSRGEWEQPVADLAIDLAALKETPAGECLRGHDGALAPVFETVVERTVFLSSQRGSTIEVALDRGSVVAGRKTVRFLELELELKSGEPADLFRLVRRLEAVPSLRIGVLTKSERGYALLGSKKRRAHKAEPIVLSPETAAADAFRLIIQSCLRQFRLNEALLPDARGPEPLHQARVGMRRLRSALSLFADLVADNKVPALRRRLQAVSQELGEARNLDVFLAESARPEAERDAHEPGVAAFLAEIESRRAASYAKVLETLASPGFRRLTLDLVRWIETGPWSTDDDPLRQLKRAEPIRVAAAAILERSHKALRRKGRDLAKLDPHERHRVRIAAKKLRYASEFFASLAGTEKSRARHAQFLSALETLQEGLGALNDIETGHGIALSFAASGEDGAPGDRPSFAAARLSGRQDSETGPLLEAAERDFESVRDMKPFWRKWGKA